MPHCTALPTYLAPHIHTAWQQAGMSWLPSIPRHGGRTSTRFFRCAFVLLPPSLPCIATLPCVFRRACHLPPITRPSVHSVLLAGACLHLKVTPTAHPQTAWRTPTGPLCHSSPALFNAPLCALAHSPNKRSDCTLRGVSTNSLGVVGDRLPRLRHLLALDETLRLANGGIFIWSSTRTTSPTGQSTDVEQRGFSLWVGGNMDA